MITKWLVWSNEHKAWWGPDNRGYVAIISAAGRYSQREALDILAGANFHLPKDAEPNEVMVLAPESYATIEEAHDHNVGLVNLLRAEVTRLKSEKPA